MSSLVRPALALAAIVVVAFSLFSALGWRVDSPRVFSDELLYMETAASLVDGDGLRIRGEPYRYAPIYPVVLGAVLWVAPDRELAYEIAKLLNALFFALTAVPVYLLARRVLEPWPSVAAAGFAVAIPSAMYVSVLMTESLAYLACAWALYAIARALERPSMSWQVAALLSILVATGVRTQFLVLYAAYVSGLVLMALLVPARSRRSRAVITSIWPTGVSLVIGLAALAGLSALAPGDGVFGAYSTLLRAYEPPQVGKWLVYQLANLDLYLGVVPFVVAPIVLASLFAHARRGEERQAAFLALFVTTSSALLLLTAAFNTTVFAGQRLHDRPVFYIVPLWLVVFFLWLAEGSRRPLAASGIGGGLALVLPFVLPFPEYARDEAPLQFNAVATTLWVSIDKAVAEIDISGLAILLPFVLGLVLATLLLPPRLVYVLPFVVFTILALESELSWNVAERVARLWAAAALPGERIWIDDRVANDRSVMLLTAGACTGLRARDGFYLSEFFNASVDRVAHFDESPESLPYLRVRLGRSGRVRLVSGQPLVADYVVAQRPLQLGGRRLGEGTSARLVLWDVGGPVRVLNVSSHEELEQAACGSGTRFAP